MAPPSIAQLINRMQTDPNPSQGYSWNESTLKYKGRLVLVPTFDLKNQILMELHSSARADHFRFKKTYACARHSFFWLGMMKDIYTFFSLMLYLPT